MRCSQCILSCAIILAITAAGSAWQDTQPASIVSELRREAAQLATLVKSELAQRFLAATTRLPEPTSRTLFRNSDRSRTLSAEEFARLTETERSDYKPVELPPAFYYRTRYGSPLAYARALDLAAQAGLAELRGRRVLDFGYGGIGHLRLLAECGAHAVGVDVDPLLAAYYAEPNDTGDITSADAKGRITLMHGRFPGEERAKEAVGGSYDLILSKNTLKNGYINPERQVDPRMLVSLGVDHDVFVRALFDALKPGGILLIYNICPAPAPPDKPYIPWADGRSPFSEETLKNAGFRVLAFDARDDLAARALGKAMGWDQGPNGMNLESDLFAWYTLLQRPDGPTRSRD